MSKSLMHVVVESQSSSVEQSTKVSTPFTNTSAYSVDEAKCPYRLVIERIDSEKLKVPENVADAAQPEVEHEMSCDRVT